MIRQTYFWIQSLFSLNDFWLPTLARIITLSFALISTLFLILIFHIKEKKLNFYLLFFAVFIFCLIVNQIRFRTTLLGSLLFVLFAHPVTFLDGTGNIQYFLNSYFDFGKAMESVLNEDIKTPASFPNVMTTISEVDRIELTEVFRRILSNPILGWVGFASFFVLMVFHWQVLLPLSPMLALGMLSFNSSNRFIMYLAPFIGIGLGWIISLVIEGLIKFFPMIHKGASRKNGPATKFANKNINNGINESICFVD